VQLPHWIRNNGRNHILGSAIGYVCANVPELYHLQYFWEGGFSMVLCTGPIFPEIGHFARFQGKCTRRRTQGHHIEIQCCTALCSPKSDNLSDFGEHKSVQHSTSISICTMVHVPWNRTNCPISGNMHLCTDRGIVLYAFMEMDTSNSFQLN